MKTIIKLEAKDVVEAIQLYIETNTKYNFDSLGVINYSPITGHEYTSIEVYVTEKEQLDSSSD